MKRGNGDVEPFIVAELQDVLKQVRRNCRATGVVFMQGMSSPEMKTWTIFAEHVPEYVAIKLNHLNLLFRKRIQIEFIIIPQ